MSSGPTGVIYTASESTVITGVDYKLRQFRLWNPKTDEGDRPMDGVVEDEALIEGRRADVEVFGDRILTYDVPGQILLVGDGTVLTQPFAVRDWVIEGGDVIIDRAGWGQIRGEIEVLSTVAGKVGEYIDLEAPHQVNALTAQDPVTQRGGTRAVQIIGRTEKAGTSVLQLLDAGLLAQAAPEAPDSGTGGNDANDGVPVPELSLAASDDAPLTIATVTVSNAADITPLGGDVELEYAVQDTEPVVDGTATGPVLTSQGIDEFDLPAIESGETIWVRGRTYIAVTNQRSDFSDWISITLGPDDDGSGGVLPAISLTLTITSAGVVSASATGISDITKVYFAPGSPTGTSPDYADVLAGTLDSAAPFTASSIATIAEGETLIVGAIGEDALGNRTILVTKSIARGVDGGVSTGTPGNWSHAFVTEAGGTFVLGAGGLAPESLGTGKYRRVLGPYDYVRGQATVMVKGYVTSYLDVAYSLDDGYSWPGLLGLRVPLKDIDDEIGTKGFKHAVGLAVQSPVTGDVLLDAVVAGGDDIEVPEILNFIVESTSTEPPPAEGEDEPVTPEIPTINPTLEADWDPTEGSGGTVADKS